MVSPIEAGRSSIKGLTVEETGQRWALQRFERIVVGGERRAITVARKEVEEILRFPKLAENDPLRWTVRFSPWTGHIYIPRWREASVITEGDRRRLVNAEDFYQLRRRGEHRIDLSDLPSRLAVELVYMKLRGLEAAIRQQRYILGERAEEEAAQVKQTMGWISFLLQATLEGRLTRQSITVLARQTAETLDSSGLSRANGETKRRIREALMKATRLDSRERVNPLVTRIRLRSAYLNAVRRQALAVLVGEKFASFLGLLLMEREFTRQMIQGGIEDLDTFAGITKRGAIVFEKRRARAYSAEREGMKRVLWAIAKSLAQIRVLPYLPAARTAAINLVGCREKHREANRPIIGEAADVLFEMPPVVKLIEWQHFQEAKMRIENLSYRSLEMILEETKDIGGEILEEPALVESAPYIMIK